MGKFVLSPQDRVVIKEFRRRYGHEKYSDEEIWMVLKGLFDYVKECFTEIDVVRLKNFGVFEPIFPSVLNERFLHERWTDEEIEILRRKEIDFFRRRMEKSTGDRMRKRYKDIIERKEDEIK